MPLSNTVMPGAPSLVSVPLPSWPLSLLPKHLTAPALVNTHRCEKIGAGIPRLMRCPMPPLPTTFTAPLENPVTSCGLRLDPNPQHFKAPAEVIAHVDHAPARMDTMSGGKSITSTGVQRSTPWPSPIWPMARVNDEEKRVLAPQHLTPPAAIRAQLCRFPAEISTTPLV